MDTIIDIKKLSEESKSICQSIMKYIKFNRLSYHSFHEKKKTTISSD